MLEPLTPVFTPLLGGGRRMGDRGALGGILFAKN